MSLPLAAIAAALYSRLATAADGASARALLTGGVLTAAQIEGGPATLPAPPFAVWREGVVAGQGDVIRRVFAAWWVYVPGADTRLQGQIIEAIEALYTPWCVSGGQVQAGPIGQGAPDPEVGNLYARPLTVSYIRRS